MVGNRRGKDYRGGPDRGNGGKLNSTTFMPDDTLHLVTRFISRMEQDLQLAIQKKEKRTGKRKRVIITQEDIDKAKEEYYKKRSKDISATREQEG